MQNHIKKVVRGRLTEIASNPNLLIRTDPGPLLMEFRHTSLAERVRGPFQSYVCICNSIVGFTATPASLQA